MKLGDIVLIKFPFTDLSAAKVRPALVISNDEYNRREQDILFMLITSNTNRLAKEDLQVDSKQTEYKLTGLKKDSAFRVNKIHTLDKNIAVRKLGYVGTDILSEIKSRLKSLLNI